MSSYGWLIEATVTSSIAAIIILFIRFILKEKLSGKLKYYLWIIFLVRLMVIPLPESKVSIYNFIENKTIIKQQGTVSPISTIEDKAPETLTSHNKAEINSSSLEGKFNLETLLLRAYQWGVIFFLLISITSYDIFINKAKKNSCKINTEYLERLRIVKRNLNIKRRINLVYGDTPFIYGIFKVNLVIPKGISIEEVDALLVHELIHYKYGDLYINWLLIFLKSIYWFNPIVWLVFNQIRKDCEVACDERVLEGSYVDKKCYATFLFKNALKGNKYLVGTSSFSKEGSNIKKRIKRIQKFRKKSTLLVVLGMTVFLVVGALCLTNGNSNNTLANKGSDISGEVKPNNEVPSNTSTNTSLNDMEVLVKEYILNGQGDKPEAKKLKWSKTFLDKVDFKTMYDKYMAEGGTANDVQGFAEYITLNAPIQSNWEELFKKDVLDTYKENIVSIKHLEGELYQGNIMINGVETAYVVVSARTGQYHGTSETSAEGVKGKVQLYEGIYFDSRRYGGENAQNPYCEIEISNITDSTFDFTVYEVEYTDLPNSDKKEKKVIFLTNTAVFIDDGTKAAFYGKGYTLNFTFPNNHNAYPVVTDIKVDGFKPLEGNIYLNNGIPGHEFG